MKGKFLILLLPVFFLFSTCKKDEPEVEPTIERTFGDVLNDFSAIDLSPGIHDEQLEFSTGTFWDFRIIAPVVEESKKYPLVIDLHGASGGDPNAHKHSNCYLEEGFENMEAFMISPNGGNLQWNHLDNQEMVINLAQIAKMKLPIDTDKIIVTGYSNGGNGSWFYGEVHNNLFTAAIPMASSYSTIHTDGSVRVMPVPMYVIHGQEDELFPWITTQDWVSQSVEEGSNIEFVLAPGLSHYTTCEYVTYLQNGVEWLKDSIW